MAFPTLWGSLCGSAPLKTPPCLSLRMAVLSLSTSCSSMAAEKFYTHLLKTPENPERTLATVNARLDLSCVTEVLRRCFSTHNGHLGIRFFAWAGVQPYYRHSGYMYGRACKLLEIDQNPERISEVVDAYRAEGCAVSVRLFKVIVGLCREAKAANEALWVLRRMVEFGCRLDTTLYNVVIRLFCEKGEVDVAVGLMREMGSNGCCPDVITYVVMVKGFCNAGRIQDACDLLKVMKNSDCSVNSVLYSALLDGICRSGCFEKALTLLEAMEKEGGDCSPNVITYTSVIQRFCEKGQSAEAMRILDRMEGFGCAPNYVTVNALVSGLCSEGLVSKAYELVHKIAAGGSVTQGKCYSSLVMSLLRVKRLDEAEKLFTWMLTHLVKPDGLACSSLIKTLCFEGRALDGFNLYGSIEKKGFQLSIDSDACALLLDGLCRQNHMVEAAKLANLMAERKIQVKPSRVQSMISYLNESQGLELLSALNRIQKSC